MEYDEVCLNYFLEHQSQLFDENVADSLEEAEAFLRTVWRLSVTTSKK